MYFFANLQMYTLKFCFNIGSYIRYITVIKINNEYCYSKTTIAIWINAAKNSVPDCKKKEA